MKRTLAAGSVAAMLLIGAASTASATPASATPASAARLGRLTPIEYETIMTTTASQAA